MQLQINIQLATVCIQRVFKVTKRSVSTMSLERSFHSGTVLGESKNA